MTPPAAVPDLHRAYRAVLVAVSYPGRPVPVAATAAAALRLVLLSTWDPGTPLALAGAAPELPWEAVLVPAAEAELLVVGGRCSGGALAGLPRGDEDRPEIGATAVYSAGRGADLRVRLRGPGIAGHLDTVLPLDPDELAVRDQACADWPRGVDLLAVDDRGRITALPRTTRVEPRR
jgi:alpha-D-ribose 1-methylphosphonate 5-triphosphate synthase subunit PhnH